MSCNYAEGLSHYEHKGKLGLPEKFDSKEKVEEKVKILAEWIKASNHTVFHTGAGISTSAGIPDFRGPKGVWTLEKKGLKPQIDISFDDAKPTKTHMAIKTLEKHGKMQYVITQNIDGLHLRSGLCRKRMAELHGNMFVDKCNFCNRLYVRSCAATTVGQKTEGIGCMGTRNNGRKCRGKLYDTILDWEDSLPDNELDLADMNSCIADLSICLGTTLQIVPSGNLPVHTKKRGGKLVICNLQPTKQDKHADLIINYYVDYVMGRLLDTLGIELLEYSKEEDPVCIAAVDPFDPIDWTIPDEWVKDKELNNKVKNRKILKRTSTDGNSKIRKKIKLDKSVDSEKQNNDSTNDHSDGDLVNNEENCKLINSEVKKENKNSEIKIDSNKSEIKLNSNNPEFKIESHETAGKIENHESKGKLDSHDSNIKIDINNLTVKIDSKDSSVKLDSHSSDVKIDTDDSKVGMNRKDSKVKINSLDSESKIDIDDAKVTIDSNDSKVKIDSKDSEIKIGNDVSKEEMDSNDSKAAANVAESPIIKEEQSQVDFTPILQQPGNAWVPIPPIPGPAT